MKRLLDHTPEEQLEILKTICNKIYIARNISMDSLDVIRQLVIIDELFRSDAESYCD